MIYSLSNFLPEIQYMILEQLPPACLRLMSLVNKHFANLALDNALWKQHLKNDFPNRKYTIDWDDCFKEYSRWKKNWFNLVLSKPGAQLWVAIEENNLEEIKEIFPKISMNAYLPLDMGRLIKAQKNVEIFQFLSQAIPGIHTQGFKTMWELTFEKIVPYDDTTRPAALRYAGVLNFETDILDERQKKRCLQAAAAGGYIEIFNPLFKKYPRLEITHYEILSSAISLGRSKFVEFYFKTFSPLLDKSQLFQLAVKASIHNFLSTLEILTPHLSPEDFQQIFNDSIDVSSYSIDCMCYLIEKGADIYTKINFVDRGLGEKTPLYLTVFFKVYPAAKFLLSKGADPNIDFPLEVAIENKDEKMIELLLENGAQTSTPSLK